jgi:transposase
MPRGGRPSIAPERLLKASLLIALYSVRSERLFCEVLDYNMDTDSHGRLNVRAKL